MTIFQKTTTLDLYNAINNYQPGSYNFEENTRNLICQCLYKEIKLFSKEQLEEITNQNGRKLNIFYAATSRNNQLAFVAMIEQGAFVNELPKTCQWLLKNIDNIPLGLWQHIFDSYKQGLHKDNLKNYTEFNITFNNITYFIKDLTDPFQKYLADTLYKYFSKKEEKEFFNYLFSHTNVEKVDVNLSPLAQYYYNKLIEDRVDLTNNDYLNSLLPKENYPGSKELFHINVLDKKRIHKLLELGFRFDENKYQLHGDTLMTALLKSTVDYHSTVAMLVPYLTRMAPNQNTTREEQESLVERFINTSSYKTIKSHYLINDLEKKIPHKPTENYLPKIKI